MKILNWLEKKLTLTIRVEDVLKYDKAGKLYLGNDLMTENEIKSIQEEIKYIEKTRIWQIWQNTLRQVALEIGTYKSTNFEDMRTMKTMLRNLYLLEEMNAIFKGWKAPIRPAPKPKNPIEY